MKNTISLVIFLLTLFHILHADDLSISMQYLPRAEYRSGYLTPLSDSAQSANFIMQRARIGIDYQKGPMQFSLSFQETRVWGQDMSTIAKQFEDQNDGMMIHEAWGKYTIDSAFLNQSIAIKFGRQEIRYEDHRLLGNLDWLRQGRRHDAIIIDFKSKDGSFLDIGLAFNQNSETKSGDYYKGSTTSYPPGSNGISQMYKSFLFAYYSGTTVPIKILFFNDNFSHLTDSLHTGSVTSRFTTGISYTLKSGNMNVSTSGYYQFGYDPNNVDLSAYFIDFEAKYTLDKISLGLLYDFSSGTNVINGKINNSKSTTFDPLYGTPHKFYGFMDYYYAGSSIGFTGVQDIKGSILYNIMSGLMVSMDIHSFSMTSEYVHNDKLLDKNLGFEVDVTTAYKPIDNVKIEIGACTYSTTNALSILKNVKSIDKISSFLYLAFRFEDFLSLIKK